MSDQDFSTQLNQMLSRLNDKQKNKLQSILSNEKSLKSALSNLDKKKAQETLEKLQVNISAEDLQTIAEETIKQPDFMKNLKK